MLVLLATFLLSIFALSLPPFQIVRLPPPQRKLNPGLASGILRFIFSRLCRVTTVWNTCTFQLITRHSNSLLSSRRLKIAEGGNSRAGTRNTSSELKCTDVKRKFNLFIYTMKHVKDAVQFIHAQIWGPKSFSRIEIAIYSRVPTQVRESNCYSKRTANSY